MIGIASTLWLSNARLKNAEFPVEPGHEWFAIPTDVFETSLAIAIKKQFRNVLKIILIWLLDQYRKISREITIKQVVKQKVRAFLSDHDHTHPHTPSEFLKAVKESTIKRVRKTRTPKIIQGSVDTQSSSNP
jgi:hypothetical protein